MNNHPKKLKDIIEENKNNTMEITQTIKSRFFNNENKYAMNLKNIGKKNKGNKTKKNLNSEINLLNKFMKEFEEKKNCKKKEYKTQRESNYINENNNKKIWNYNYDSIYNDEKMKNLDNYNFYYTKRMNNNKNNKGNSTTYLRRKNKINFYDNDYLNLNHKDIEKYNEISNFTNVKNMKYSSLEKSSTKNRIHKYSESGEKNNILINNKSNYLMKLYYSYANQKI